MTSKSSPRGKQVSPSFHQVMKEITQSHRVSRGPGVLDTNLLADIVLLPVSVALKTEVVSFGA